MHSHPFIRVMSWKSVTDAKDPSKLAKHVEKIIVKMESRGIDPLNAFRGAADYLVFSIDKLVDTHKPGNLLVRGKDPKRIGSKAWYEYMLGNVRTIIGILADRKLNKMFDK